MARKQATKRSASSNGGGNATQTILNTIASVSQMNGGSKDVPREEVINYLSCQAPMGKSTIANALTKLRKEGLVDTSKKGFITISKKGMDKAAFKDMSNLTNEDFQKSMKEKLTSRQCALFDYLADGKVRAKKEAAAAIGCKMNSTWANMLTPMKKLGIIEFGRETINLTKKMFPLGIPADAADEQEDDNLVV